MSFVDMDPLDDKSTVNEKGIANINEQKRLKYWNAETRRKILWRHSEMIPRKGSPIIGGGASEGAARPSCRDNALSNSKI